jgi:CheY-like chemotaxis protein
MGIEVNADTPGPGATRPDESTESERMMALIGVVSDCKETAVELEEVLSRRGHRVEPATGHDTVCGVKHVSVRGRPALDEQHPAIYVVDLDCEPGDAVLAVRELSEDPHSALAPVLVAASPESHGQVALACAYGATGLLKKPFTTRETVPDTERALAVAYPAE